MNPLIVGLSGPPRAGKDTITEILVQRVYPQAAVRRMSAPLKSIALQFLTIPQRRDIEARKDQPLIDGRPTTYRTLQIAVYKMGALVFGPDWLGHQFMDMLQYCRASLVFVPDFGRPEEVQVLLDAGLHVLQINVRRPGTTFEGDSRIDFTLPDSIVFNNCGSLNQLEERVFTEIAPWIDQCLT